MSFIKFFLIFLFLSLKVFSSTDIFRPYQQLNQKFVDEYLLKSGGLISSFDYSKAMQEKATFDYIRDQKITLSKFDPSKLIGRNENTAFWINAYNFFMIAVILESAQKENSLIKSVKDLGSLFNPYAIFKKAQFNIGGRDYSLDEMEKDILLGEGFIEKNWKDARVHFAVNCASVSCPALRKEIYSADNIENLLEENTSMALRTSLHFKKERQGIAVTHLFKWYEKDLGKTYEFISRYLPDEKKMLLSEKLKIYFIPYNWDLNSPENYRGLGLIK